MYVLNSLIVPTGDMSVTLVNIVLLALLIVLFQSYRLLWEEKIIALMGDRIVPNL